ncbi:MAG: hypothetical protein AAFP89_12680 [Bacteroidota bacterium]
MPESFESMLTGGHPNSLGRTLEVVDLILQDHHLLEDLYSCYQSEDEVVRLRTSNAMKRICKVHPEWIAPFLPRLLKELTQLDQASAQWTLAQLFAMLEGYMTSDQWADARDHMKHNLAHHTDWIVLNTTMEVLFEWSKQDPPLREWLPSQLERHASDRRKSVSKRATKYLNKVG